VTELTTVYVVCAVVERRDGLEKSVELFDKLLPKPGDNVASGEYKHAGAANILDAYRPN